MKKIFKIVIYAVLISAVCLYFGIVFLVPQIINNTALIDRLQSLIHKKTGIETVISGLNLKISPNLAAVLNAGSINAKKDNDTLIEIKNVSLDFKLLQKYTALISAESVYVNGKTLKQQKKREKNSKNDKFELNNLPEIHVQNLTYESDEINVYAQNINAENGIISINADVKAPYLKDTLKLGASGSLEASEGRLKADKFEIQLGNSKLYIDGYLLNKNEGFDFSLKGSQLPVSELMPMLLHFQKAKDPSKKFIENFKNFKGVLNIDLKINKEGIFGRGAAHNLGADAVWFNIPVFFKEAVFNFQGQKINSIAEGILGREKVTHTLNISNLTSPDREVIGEMKTTLAEKFDYVPNLTILNSVNFGLVYKIKNKKPDVYYSLNIPAGSDLIYNSFYLGLRDYKRKVHAETLKDGSNLYLKEYWYSYIDSAGENVIISGDGLFAKNIDKSSPDKFIPRYITCRTNGFAPISVTGSFGEKIRGGEFRGSLKYDFSINQVLGTFDIQNARHQAFHIENAHVSSKNGVFNITSSGMYKGEKYSAELDIKNNIYGETLIYNMKLFLDKLVFKTESDTKRKKKKINSREISQKVRNADITVNNWEIAVNEIKRDKFVLNNVKLIGSLKNSIFNFNMQDLGFADGIVRANGLYNFSNDESEISFEAENINADKASEMMLNLQNQIEGAANAKVNLKAKDIFRFLDVNCVFEIKEGFLPRLGDTEFVFKNSKYKLSEITNYDLSQKDEMKADIKGSFDVHNTELNNVSITSWSELSAMYLEGSYEMEKQTADLQLFWKYSKDAPKGVRILFIPLRLILKAVFRPEYTKDIYRPKLEKVPDINADEKNTYFYRIGLKGDINNNKIELVLKEIR